MIRALPPYGAVITAKARLPPRAPAARAQSKRVCAASRLRAPAAASRVRWRFAFTSLSQLQTLREKRSNGCVHAVNVATNRFEIGLPSGRGPASFMGRNHTSLSSHANAPSASSTVEPPCGDFLAGEAVMQKCMIHAGGAAKLQAAGASVPEFDASTPLQLSSGETLAKRHWRSKHTARLTWTTPMPSSFAMRLAAISSSLANPVTGRPRNGGRASLVPYA